MTRILIASDLHLCHINWYGVDSRKRMDYLLADINAYHREKPIESIVLLGDYSLDFWEWDICGCYINEGRSDTEEFVRDFIPRFPAPVHMIPGNHEQYGNAKWRELTGSDRRQAFVLGGYLFILCDNFSGLLDPTGHSDGVYTNTDLSFIREKMAEYPDLPVILGAHFFDTREDMEPESFYAFLKEEPRITALFCGHDHETWIEDLGERAGGVKIIHDGSYSYTHDTAKSLWGFCEVTLCDSGIEAVYIAPAHEAEIDGEMRKYPYAELNRIVISRRDR